MAGREEPEPRVPAPKSDRARSPTKADSAPSRPSLDGSDPERRTGSPESPPQTPEPPRRRRLRWPRRRRSWIPRPEALRKFARAHRLRFTEGNGVELFETGEAGLAAMLEAIEASRQHVHLETYILRPDATGARFVRALEARARAGIEVRVVLDAVGSWLVDDAFVAGLREAGGDVVWFNPVSWAPSRPGLRRRDHRKLLIVDGQTAFTGGLNIGDEYNHGPASGVLEWRDAHVRIEGPAVRDLQAVFLESWFRADGPDLPWHTFLDVTPTHTGSVRCTVLADGPMYRRRRMRELLISALTEVQHCARLESPYFAPGRRVLDALATASTRGVDVRLLLAGRSDHPILYRAARSILPRLLERGVSVHEFDRSMMHAKVAVFDREWAILGTSNLDRQSFEYSYEVNLILEGAVIAGKLHDHIERNLEESRSIDPPSLEARTRAERLLDWIASLLLHLV